MRRISTSIQFRSAAACLVAIAMCLTASVLPAQELVLTPAADTGSAGIPRPVVIFPDLGSNLASPFATYVAPLDFPRIAAHGLAMIAADRALVTQEHPSLIETGGVTLIDTATGMRIDSYDLPHALPVTTPPTLYDGFGTLAINPAKTHILAITGVNSLWVISAPFDHTAAVSVLALPSSTGTIQTRAIAFDSSSGRAYIAVRTGILVVDPPYTSIAFTIPSSNGSSAAGAEFSGAIALSPDNSTLVASRGVLNGGPGIAFGPEMRIFHAPFSAASVPDVLTIPGSTLDGMTFTPDGTKVMIVDATDGSPALPRVYVVAAPFSGASTVDTLQFDSGGAHLGFEDVDISDDGQLAALSGGDFFGDPFVVLKAPFTAAGFSFATIQVPQFQLPYQRIGRGAGTARFWSTAIAASPPQVWVDYAATDQLNQVAQPTGGVTVVEGDIGMKDATVPIHLSGPSAQTVTVDYTTVDGTATAADNDYVPASGTLVFAPGETTRNIVVKVVGDTQFEATEHFKVVISNPVNATLLATTPDFADTGTILIVNDDASVPVAITSGPPPNGVAGTPYSFQLTGTGALPLAWSSGDLPFGLTLDAASGVISGVPVFPQTISVVVTLFDANQGNASAFYTITITGVGQPVLDVLPGTRDFGTIPVGSTSPIVQVIFQNSGFGPLILGSPFLTIPPGSDFAVATGDFLCVDGQTLLQAASCARYFTFTPKTVGPQSLVLALSSNAVVPQSLTLTGTGSGAALPVLTILNATSVLEGNSGTSQMTFAVTLSPLSASPVTVNYAATGGTATIGVDYTVAGTGTLTFTPAIITQFITVNVIGDTQAEPDETIVMTLSSPSGATLGTATATGTILNDDASLPILSVLSGSGAFGDQLVGTTSTPRTVTIGNTGSANLVLANPFAPLPSGAFAYASGTNSCTDGQTLAPTATCKLYLTFAPVVLGSSTANDLLASNAAPVTLSLSGDGVSATAISPAAPIPVLMPGTLALLAAMLGLCAHRSIVRVQRFEPRRNCPTPRIDRLQ